MTDATFSPAHRLHSNRDFGRVFHRQQKAAGRNVVVLVLPRARKGPQEGRLGVMIGAKAVKTAVRRHQLKRWLRELFRTRLKTVLAGHDCIVLFRGDPQGPEEEQHARLDEEVTGLVGKALGAQAQPGQRGGRGGGRGGQGAGGQRSGGQGQGGQPKGGSPKGGQAQQGQASANRPGGGPLR